MFFRSVTPSGSPFKGVLLTTTGAVSARVISAALGFLSVPILVAGLGKSDYGMLITFTAFSAFLVFIDQGLAVGVRTAVAKSVALNDPEEAYFSYLTGLKKIVPTCMKVSFSFGVLSFSTGLLYPIAADNGGISYVLIYLAIVTFSGSFSVPLRALEGYGKSWIASLLPMLSSLWILLSSILGLILQLDLLFYLVCAGLALAPAGSVAAFLIARQKPIRSGRDFGYLGQEVIASPWALMVISTMLSVLSSAVPIAISLQFSPVEVADYGAVAKIGAFALVVVSAGSPFLWSHFASERATGRQSPKKSRVIVALIFGFTGAALALVLGSLGPGLIEIWLGFETEKTTGFAWAFGLLIFVTALQIVPGNAQNDSKSLKFQALTTTLGVVAAIPMWWLFGGLFGAYGPVLASAISMLLFHSIPLWARWLNAND